MAKIDEVKEFINFLKSIFITLVVIETSLIAYSFQTYLVKNQTINLYAIIVLVLIIIFAIIIGCIFIRILKEIKKLKDL